MTRDEISRKDIQKAIEWIISENQCKYEYFGIRIDFNEYEDGEICEISHDLIQNWEEWMANDDEWEKVTLPDGAELYDTGLMDGTACLTPKQFDEVFDYPGCRLHLIADDERSFTGYADEYFMPNAVCLASWEVQGYQY